MEAKSIFPRMHVSYYVSDLEKSVAFYDAFFNKPADKIKAGYAKYILEQPALVISFIENKERVNANFGHLGIQVETKAELEQYLQLAKEKGLVEKEEIGTACCYAIQDKFWVNDPDGVQWEVYYFHEDAEFNDPQYETKSAEVCCTPGEPAQKAELNVAGVQEEACCEPGSGCC
ncbi:ArsI/CadI family heavy metal resistance metalloenzyme [Flexithrix dorotheae]|uniref:ArsI/CadI family heavy metal resistance metalloenzyme n=1 Tax=Flexithrix dorotheae TaxID=70993 RepID=UPI0003803BF2|nr:ArsI/CadI family heavy metal resistance metalloenzyme [Flexithrix dorotheae]